MTTQPLAPAPASTKPPIYTRRWVIGLASLLVGIGLGAAVAAADDPKKSSEYKALTEELSSSEGLLDTATTQLEVAKSRLADIEGSIPARESAVIDKETELKARAEQVAADEKAVAKREKAVGIVEREIEANTIAGDGIYEVGVDMKAGKYKMAGASCYYAVLSDANGNNIISNNNVEGPALVVVSRGQFFETSGCDDWVLQR